MLLRIVFVFALGGTNVAAELAGQINKKLPWSYLYTDQNCTPKNPENNKDKSQWSVEIDITKGETWKYEEKSHKGGERRRSLWLPGKGEDGKGRDSKHSGPWCFYFYPGSDGNGPHDVAQIYLDEDKDVCYNFDSSTVTDEFVYEGKRKRSRSRDLSARQQQGVNNGNNGKNGGNNGGVDGNQYSGNNNNYQSGNGQNTDDQNVNNGQNGNYQNNNGLDNSNNLPNNNYSIDNNGQSNSNNNQNSNQNGNSNDDSNNNNNNQNGGNGNSCPNTNNGQSVLAPGHEEAVQLPGLYTTGLKGPYRSYRFVQGICQPLSDITVALVQIPA